jgi:hypothetical protein
VCGCSESTTLIGNEEAKQLQGNLRLFLAEWPERARRRGNLAIQIPTVARHHISSCTGPLSSIVQDCPKQYAVAELGRLPESVTVRHCLGPSGVLATDWLQRTAGSPALHFDNQVGEGRSDSARTKLEARRELTEPTRIWPARRGRDVAGTSGDTSARTWVWPRFLVEPYRLPRYIAVITPRCDAA